MRVELKRILHASVLECLRGINASFAYPAQVLNSSLALEKPSGGWTADGMAYLNVDGVYQATRPSLQLGK